jgi:hypothetical protein
LTSWRGLPLPQREVEVEDVRRTREFAGLVEYLLRAQDLLWQPQRRVVVKEELFQLRRLSERWRQGGEAVPSQIQLLERVQLPHLGRKRAQLVPREVKVPEGRELHYLGGKRAQLVPRQVQFLKDRELHYLGGERA